MYVATELYMLQDDSENKEATWEFLDRQIGIIISVMGAVKTNGTLAESILNGAFSVASILKPQNLGDSEMLRK